MKKISILLLLTVVISSTMFVGCKKVPSMSAEVDGVAKNFTLRATNKVQLKDGIEAISLMASTGASFEDSEFITILIKGDDKGTYELNATLTNPKTKCLAYYNPRDTSNLGYAANKGTVTITEISKKYISGTFEFEMRDKLLDSDVKRITKGKFENLRYGTASADKILKYFED